MLAVGASRYWAEVNMIETLAVAAVLIFFVGMGVSVAPATLNRSNRSSGGSGFRRNGALAFPTSPPA